MKLTHLNLNCVQKGSGKKQREMVDKAQKFSAFSIANYKEISQSKINTLTFMFTSLLQWHESRITSNDALFP